MSEEPFGGRRMVHARAPIRHCCQWTWGVISAFAAATKP